MVAYTYGAKEKIYLKNTIDSSYSYDYSIHVVTDHGVNA